MVLSLSKNYQPQDFEEDIYLEWEKAGLFKPEYAATAKQKYCNILPPPNANGELHLGHSSGYTLMDILGRYQRMLGKQTLLLPGKDHAGIQTQVVYEKKIKTERNLTRQDLGRESFYKEVYDFCQDRMVYMRQQEKKLGLSADWSREKFTLEPSIVKIVLETFIQMYQEKDPQTGQRLVYRGERIINWCPRCATALSDFEVEYEEKKDRLYWLKYGPFVLATTRPETKLGDTAVAVHPDDKRYQKMIGQKFMIPGVLGEFEITVVADRAVDPNFGSGAIKVTPAHSFIDNEIAQRHQLASRQIINEEGKMMSNCGKYAGLTTSEARQRIVKDMEKMGLIDHIEENYQHNLSICERCKTPIEPLPSKQWFVAMDHPNFSFKKAARQAIEKDRIKIYPQRFKKIMLSWIDNVHDWCISRQIWWGPQIPAWYKNDQIKVQLESPGQGWQQDSDTFDTWFSSGQWAYSTLGGPKQPEFERFYPSQIMIMGRDILPLWAFRMIILGLYRTGQVPFQKIYFTGLVRDEKGQKMSKSKGNGVEPLTMIKKYGADALRLSLVIGSSAGKDLNLGETKIAGFRNLINKIWNIARFILTRLESEQNIFPKAEKLPVQNLTLADRWIIDRIRHLIKNVSTDLESLHPSAAGEKLRDFTWNELADWYLEICKFETNSKEKNQLLFFLLRDLLKLWHPFIPFVSEKIWQELNLAQPLMVSAWPSAKNYSFSATAVAEFHLIQSIIGALRNFRAQSRLVPKQKIEVIIHSPRHSSLLKKQKMLLESLRTGAQIKFIEKNTPPTKSLPIFLPEIKIYILLEQLFDLKKEITRIKKEILETEKTLKKLNCRLANQKFIQKAPVKIVQEEKARQKNYQEKIMTNKNYLASLEKAL